MIIDRSNLLKIFTIYSHITFTAIETLEFYVQELRKRESVPFVVTIKKNMSFIFSIQCLVILVLKTFIDVVTN